MPRPPAVAALALFLALAASAAARTVSSPPMAGGGASEGFACLVLNAGKKPLKAAVAEVRESGGLVLSNSVPLEGLAPGEVQNVATLPTGTPRTVYCAVEGKVSEKTLRLTLCVAGSTLYNCVTGP